ncbi:TetR/AcrR family transcriptional regulator [Mangrovihabitans endophyticus]|uniref:TetR family transcriptional regulator n=1 Tax=Mangrovihabitans endophyticus TaxID=1751298 RepID=A0A8J3BX77_9ACTN|nr:TetR/AcrR family transcriptional regulator [Mangrovihabitans endophyticus]GGK77774.1 TetR family transcriptional regulator [Mangrovihabitans endophyticus]
MPRVTAEYRANRRAEIVAAAGRLFAGNGFHATSMADIIAESGLSAGAVYRYFRSKEELIAVVAETALSTADEIFGELLADGATPSPSHAVTTMIDGVMTRASGAGGTGHDLTRIALQVWAEALRSPELGRRTEEVFRRLSGHYTEVARRWQAAGHLPTDASPDQVGAAMLGLTQGFLLQHLLIADVTATSYATGVRELLGEEGSAITTS